LLNCRDAGSWDQRKARAWWQANGIPFVSGSHDGPGEPLINTEMLVDFDHRAAAETLTRIPD
jgi:hypothetical protein